VPYQFERFSIASAGSTRRNCYDTSLRARVPERTLRSLRSYAMSWKRRYSILVTLLSAYLLCYLDRLVMASAIPFIAADFHLLPSGMGAVLGAFFAGYAVMQIPGGLLVDKFGARSLLALSILCWSVSTALTGAAGSLTAMLVIRVLFGLSEGPFPPATSKVVALWFPYREIGRATGILLAGALIGAAFTPLFVTTLVSRWGWRPVFYSLMFPGLLLTSIVWIFVKGRADDSATGVSQDVPAYVGDARTSLEQKRSKEQLDHPNSSARIGLTQLLRTPGVMWTTATLFMSGLASWGLLNWLPTYLLQARGFSVIRMGVFATFPSLAGALGYVLGGLLSDRYFSERRHVPIVFGLALGSGFTCLAATAPSGEWAVAYLVAAFLCTHVASSGIFTLPLVLVPSGAVGGAFGIVNTAGQTAGFLSPILVGYLLEMSDKNFRLVFFCFVGLFLAAAAAAWQIKPTARTVGATEQPVTE